MTKTKRKTKAEQHVDQVLEEVIYERKRDGSRMNLTGTLTEFNLLHSEQRDYRPMQVIANVPELEAGYEYEVKFIKVQKPVTDKFYSRSDYEAAKGRGRTDIEFVGGEKL